MVVGASSTEPIAMSVMSDVVMVPLLLSLFVVVMVLFGLGWGAVDGPIHTASSPCPNQRPVSLLAALLLAALLVVGVVVWLGGGPIHTASMPCPNQRPVAGGLLMLVVDLLVLS